MWLRRVSVLFVLSAVVCAVATPALGDMLYGASPASLVFDGGDKGLLRGGSAERTVNLQNQGDESLTFVLSLEGPAGAWLSVAEDIVRVAPGTTHPVMVRATVPAEAANGAYSATVRITPAVPAEDDQDGASSTIVQELVIPVRIEVTDRQTLKLTVARLSVPDSEEGGRLFVEIDATNDGNVVATPQVEAVVFDEEGAERIASFRGTTSSLAPQTSARLVADLGAHALDVGSYMVRILATAEGGEVVGGGPRDLYLDIVPPGTLAFKVEAPTVVFGEGDAKKGDLVPIRVTFRNMGDAPVIAGFSGLISKGGKPVEEVKIDPLEVGSGQTGELEGFWRATGAGTFELAGKLTMGAKRVDVEPTAYTVGGTSKESPASAPMLLVMALSAIGFALRRWSS